MGDLKEQLSALLALQDEYIKLVEEENPECSESLNYYNELIDELKKNVRKSSAKYARSILQNEDFHHCLASPNGKTSEI